MSKLDGRNLNYYLTKSDISNNDIRYMPEHLKSELFNLTINCKGTIRERLYWLRHNLHQYPLCKQCGKEVTSKQFLINVKGNGYRDFCSKSCARQSDEFKARTESKMLETYGVTHTFKLESVQNKRKETNIAKYGRSHPHPWGSDTFNKNIIDKYGSVENYIQQNKTTISRGLISHYIESNRIANIIQNIENRFYVECQNIDVALDNNRISNQTRLEDIPLMWKHMFCGNTFEMPIIDGMLNVCPHCKRHGTSYLEQDVLTAVLEMADAIGTKVIHKDRQMLNPKEIDILLPDLKIGIEVNGIYWHSADRASSQYHLIEKTMLASQAGIRLIHIFENQWLNNKELIISKIKNIINLNTNKIFARKCSIEELSNDVKNVFLDANHIQGQDKALIKLGLKYNDEIVAVMTFGRPRFNRNFDWELIRFCTKANSNVVGGFSKLLKYFKHKYCFDGYKIISYRDLSWGVNEDNVYSKNGFKLISISKPSYMWASNNAFQYLTRYQTQKYKLKKLIPSEIFDDNLSESENMKKAGFLKLFNCGNAVYSYDVHL